MLVEIHMIQNHSPSNINRDDLGAPKTCMFGGSLRARISSQCLKRSIRNPGSVNPNSPSRRGLFAEAMAPHTGTRTKFFPFLVGEKLKTSSIRLEEHSRIVTAVTHIAQSKEKDAVTPSREGKEDSRSRTPQLIFLGPGHAEEFVRRLEKLRAEMKPEYDYFLNPVVAFQESVEANLATSEIDPKEHDKVINAAWLIAKLRMPELLRNEDGEMDELPPLGPDGQPGEAVAKEIVTRLTQLHLSDPERFRTLTKKAIQQEKGALKDTAPKKPSHMDKFLETLTAAHQHDAVDIALFGRMTTSDAFEDVEAAMEVAHAISTHAIGRNEVDYFTAVDDLGVGPGAAHVAENQFNSATYYKYFSLDWDILVQNLAGPEPSAEELKADSESLRRWQDNLQKATHLAGKALGFFIRAAALTIPSGKKKGHANNNLPDGILVEVKKVRIPTSYANAFVDPVKPTPDSDMVAESVKRLGVYLDCVVNGFGIQSERFWFSPRELTLASRPMSAGGTSPRTATLATPIATPKNNLDELIVATLKALDLNWAELKSHVSSEG